MTNVETQKKEGYLIKQKRSYQDIVTYLDTHWSPSKPNIIKKINFLLNDPVSSFSSIAITGTAGKSTTIHYLVKTLSNQGLKVGSFSSPHITAYNERFALNNKSISNEQFIELANIVLDLILSKKIPASSQDILAAMSFLYCRDNNVDVAIFEQSLNLQFDPITICTPSIFGITRIVSDSKEEINKLQNKVIQKIKTKSYVISADQSKLMLQFLAKKTEELHGIWIMPIRKLAPLNYPYEQLYGRCAALAERIGQIYIEQIFNNKNTSLQELEQNNQSSKPLISYQTTSSQNFWSTIEPSIPYKFQLVSHKKYTLLIDKAHNIDAFNNLFLGIRLLNFKKPFKSIHFIFGCQNKTFSKHEFIKAIRYFTKKNSCKFYFCPSFTTIGEQAGEAWNVHQMAIDTQHTKTKASTFKNFKDAFETVTKLLDNPQDLLVITGSQAIITDYYNYQQNIRNNNDQN